MIVPEIHCTAALCCLDAIVALILSVDLSGGGNLVNVSRKADISVKRCVLLNDFNQERLPFNKCNINSTFYANKMKYFMININKNRFIPA